MTNFEEFAQQSLKELLGKGMIEYDDISSEFESEGKVLRLNVNSNEPAIIIGKKGEVLFAVQQLLRLIVRREQEDSEEIQVVLDVADYRKNQEINARLIAEDVAKRVRETGKAKELAPMPSYKRRAIHTFFADNDCQYADLSVYSVGDSEKRHIVVDMKN